MKAGSLSYFLRYSLIKPTQVRDIAKTVLRRCFSPKRYRQLAHRIRFGRWIDFQNPKTLNEKILWRKTYGYRNIYSRISDKYRVREYVAEKIGERYLVPLHSVLDDVTGLCFDTLPSQFVAKPSNSSGQILVVRDKCVHDEVELRELFGRWLNSNYFLCAIEPEYKFIEPRVVIEELLLDDSGAIPIDFKFHCFAGNIEMIQVDIDRFGNHRRNFYSRNWSLLPFVWSPVDNRGQPIYRNGAPIDKPIVLDEMVSVAETLSRDFEYIRVDLYYCQGRIFFGELTLSHGGGFELFVPDKFDFIYGAKFAISKR